MKTLILSIVFGFVWFTIFTMAADVKPVLAEGELTGSISQFCAHARMEAIDRVNQGMHVEYGPELEKSCGPLN